jgi:hypothetical protein
MHYTSTNTPFSSKFNSHLEEFKNIHQGKSAILFGHGPTLKKYTPLNNSEDYIKVGVNAIYDYHSYEDIKTLNYWFFGSEYFIRAVGRDKAEDMDEICNNPELKHLVKFTSSWEDGRSHGDIGRGNITPERSRELGCIPYENNLGYFSHDIAKYATLGHDVVFPVCQFLLYMGISKIYLVGCDCGYADPACVDTGDAHLIYWWKELNKWYKQHYPKSQIIAVNPISTGLEGIFEDYYQEGFNGFSI